MTLGFFLLPLANIVRFLWSLAVLTIFAVLAIILAPIFIALIFKALEMNWLINIALTLLIVPISTIGVLSLISIVGIAPSIQRLVDLVISPFKGLKHGYTDGMDGFTTQLKKALGITSVMEQSTIFSRSFIAHPDNFDEDLVIATVASSLTGDSISETQVPVAQLGQLENTEDVTYNDLTASELVIIAELLSKKGGSSVPGDLKKSYETLETRTERRSLLSDNLIKVRNSIREGVTTDDEMIGGLEVIAPIFLYKQERQTDGSWRCTPGLGHVTDLSHVSKCPGGKHPVDRGLFISPAGSSIRFRYQTLTQGTVAVEEMAECVSDIRELVQTLSAHAQLPDGKPSDRPESQGSSSVVLFPAPRVTDERVSNPEQGASGSSHGTGYSLGAR